ncbi:signal peptidase II [Phenylobacterium sp.]|uniref:signal peptidase II n=1 Tax=Phenylobacterium sp. TaxID=1871053 RepID=UPI002C7B7E49|nr:signal peptidase II [Phenylobacterium sp.]HLZ75341.1 signal peptidase II [Phenylobacterium sp.]
MTSITKLGWTALVLALAVVVIDQATKAWILTGLNLPLRASVQLAGPFYLTMVWNPGVSFVGGFLQAHKEAVRWLLAAFSIGVAGVLVSWVRKAERPLFAIAIGLVIGGAIGNVVDRIRFGAVADFIDVSRLIYFPWIFNVADSAITVGICLLLVDMLRQDGKERAKRAPQDAA